MQPQTPPMPPGPYPYPPPYPPPRRSSLLWLWIVLGVFGFLFVIGIVAAVAIPSFMEYSKKAKRSQAELDLKRIERALKTHYIELGEFPRTAAEPTPGDCCATPEKKCAVDFSRWQQEPWTSLDFALDEPSYFSYSYEPGPDGQSYVVRAHGDLDCDGMEAVWTLTGTSPGGVPEAVLARPTRAD